jgi:integrase
MPALHLTARAVSKLQAPHPDGKATVYWDDETRGFGVLCSGKTKVRLFVVQRDVGGKTRRLTLGTVSHLKLEDARRRAEDALDELRRGNDPKKKEKTYTLAQALGEYLGPKKQKHPTLRPASVALYWQLERWLAAWLDRPLSEITFEMVDRKHKELAQEIGESTANMAMRVLRIVWNFATDRSSLPPCPVAKLRRRWFENQRRTRHVSAEQLPEFYKGVRALESTTGRDFVLLLLLTGMRRQEAATLKWSNVNLANKMIHLPREVTKAKRALDLPMSAQLFDILVARRGLVKGSAYVFPGRVGKPGFFTSHNHAFKEIEKASGIKVSAHDLRRTFASVANATDGVSWLALKTMLNHAAKGDVTAGYVQITNDQLRAAMQRVTDAILALCDVEKVSAPNLKKLR